MFSGNVLLLRLSMVMLVFRLMKFLLVLKVFRLSLLCSCLKLFDEYLCRFFIRVIRVKCCLFRCISIFSGWISCCRCLVMLSSSL